MTGLDDTFERLCDPVRRRQITGALADGFRDGGTRLNSATLDVLTRNVTFLALVDPTEAREVRRVAAVILSTIANRPSLKFIMLGSFNAGAIENLGGFISERRLVDAGRKVLSPAHAVAEEIAKAWIACDMTVTRGGAFLDTLRGVMIAANGRDDSVTGAAQWAEKNREKIAAIREMKLSRSIQ